MKPETDPSPRRKSTAAIAVICRTIGEETLWLSRWNRQWQCYFFIGGHKNDDEGFRPCLIREIGEETGWSEGRDYAAEQSPFASLVFTSWSERARVQTDYTFSLFATALRREPAAETGPGAPDIRWLRADEIRRLQCTDGKPISASMVRILDSIGWKCPKATADAPA